MSLLFGVAALGSAVLHATWSAIAYRFREQALGFACMSAITVLVGAVLVVLHPVVDSEAIPLLVASVLLHVVYTITLMRLNELAEFSALYPLSRGLSPVVVAAVAYAVARDKLTPGELAGFGLVITGLLMIVSAKVSLARANLRGLALALAVGLLIASYTVVDGVGVRASDSVLGFVGYLSVGQGLLTLAFVLGSRSITTSRLWREGPWLLATAVGALSSASYGLMIWAQTLGPLAVAAALRETSIVFAAVIGVVFLHEKAGARTLSGAGVIVAGIMVMNLTY